jgi:hypothetical protein
MQLMLSERARLALRVILFLLAFGGLVAFFLFIFFFKKPAVNTTPQPVATSSPNTSGLPTSGAQTGGRTVDTGTSQGLTPSRVADGGPTQVATLTSGAVTSPTLDNTTGDIRYYDQGDGRFYSLDVNGNVRRISEQQFPQAETVLFSPNADRALLEFPDGSNVVYNFTSAKTVTMESHWTDFAFSGDGDEIAAKSIGNNPDNRALVVSASDGSSTRVVRNLGAESDSVDISWSPSGNVLAFSRTGDGTSIFGQHMVYLMDEEGEASGVLAVNGTNLLVSWAPDGKHFLYSVADALDDYRAHLWYNDARGDRNGDTRLELDIQTTADKCTFFTAAIAYCAVPQSMPAGGGTDPGLLTSTDDLYIVTFPSGKVSRVASPEPAMQMYQLTVTQDGKTLYFTDEDGKLHAMTLK